MNKQQLASLIWDSCNDLRGSISAVEYKDVILGLIFYRFVSEKEVMELKKQDWTDEAMAEELNEEDSETIKWCQEHLGYYIAYENLFSTWIHNVEGNFSVADVTKALNAIVCCHLGFNMGTISKYKAVFRKSGIIYTRISLL